MRRISAALLLLSLGGTACSSARMDDREPDRLFRYGEYDKAAARFAEGVKRQEPNGDDLLLYLLDWGLSLHQAGKYKESNQAFLRAESIADVKDYTSLTDDAPDQRQHQRLQGRKL